MMCHFGLALNFLMKTFKKYLITFIIINEIHFSKRIKCPEGFVFVARSLKVVSKIPSIGIAIFKNITCHLQIDMVYNGLRDCVICHIKNSDIIIAAVYIPLSNSKYFDNIFFELGDYLQ